MATVNTLLSSHVTIVRSWTEGGTNGRNRVGIRAHFGAGTGDSLVMGGGTNKILANAFGLRIIEDCSNGVLDDNSKAYPLSPSADGTFLVATNPVQATDANRADVADITIANPRRMYVEVHGYT